MVTKPKVCCNINTVCLLHVSATLIAISRVVHYKECVGPGITEVCCEKVYRCCILFLGNYQASGVYMPTFRNTLFHLHRQGGVSRMRCLYVNTQIIVWFFLKF